jgi:hypothetical protein
LRNVEPSTHSLTGLFFLVKEIFRNYFDKVIFHFDKSTWIRKQLSSCSALFLRPGLSFAFGFEMALDARPGLARALAQDGIGGGSSFRRQRPRFGRTERGHDGPLHPDITLAQRLFQ